MPASRSSAFSADSGSGGHAGSTSPATIGIVSNDLSLSSVNSSAHPALVLNLTPRMSPRAQASNAMVHDLPAATSQYPMMGARASELKWYTLPSHR